MPKVSERERIAALEVRHRNAMTSIGIGALLVAMFVLLIAGIMVWRSRLSPRRISREPARITRDVAPVKQTADPASTSDQITLKTAQPTKGIWVRPSAETASRNFRRAGFAWILRQLGASNQLLDRMVDGDLEGAIKELKRQAAAGDAAAFNVLGEIVYQQCSLGRDASMLSTFQDSQLRQAGKLAPADAEWFSDALRSDFAYDKSVMVMCKDFLDQDEVFERVAAQANQGDGASEWLMFRMATNMTEMQQRLRDAATAGFPQAQFDLAWAILGGQQGAAGTDPATANIGDLLRASADSIPRSEMQLAVCEYYGCSDVTPDLNAALAHAREAAQRGSMEGLIEIGPHLTASQMDPAEVAAWTLVSASLQLRGCGGNGFIVQWMQKTTATLAAANISAGARSLADEYWQQYGAQIMSNLGCAP